VKINKSFKRQMFSCRGKPFVRSLQKSEITAAMRCIYVIKLRENKKMLYKDIGKIMGISIVNSRRLYIKGKRFQEMGIING
jgi:hypothetical protein